ncbi:TPA: siphovirus Gp157 family protein [Streptococcus agalactiae]|nr:siphovirus Gp157 family protein [Streptococcus agalactiae]
MAYLYELNEFYEKLQAMDLDDETFQDTLDSVDFQNDLESNIEYFVKMKANADADAESFKNAKNQFYEKEKQAKAKSEKYKDIINHAMRMSNKKKLETDLFKITTRDSKVVTITDETKIPLEYMDEKVTYKPIKKAIKEAIESGKSVDGAELGFNESVVIK